MLVVIATLAAAQAQAAPVLWAGHLEEDGVAVDRNVSLSFIVEDRDTVVAQVDEPSLVVVDGDFVVEFDIADDAVGPFTEHIIINGSDFGEEALGLDWPAAAVAGFADVVDHADEADAIGGTVPFDLAELASGTVPVARGNITGFPADFLDGDQGIDFTAGAAFTFSGGSIAIADGGVQTANISGALSVADLAPGAIGTADIADDSLTGADLPSVPASAIAPATFTAGHFSASQNRTTLFKITNSLCADVGTITAKSTCGAVDDCPGFERRDCNGRCGGIVNASCANTAVGDLVFK
jgi:hypothetical protein